MLISGQKQGIQKILNNLGKPNKDKSICMINCNNHEALTLLDPCTMNGDLISDTYCAVYKIPLQEIKGGLPLSTAIKGSRSTINHKATVNLDIQGYKIERTLYVCHLQDSDIILGKPALSALRAIMEIADNKVSIKPRHDQQRIYIDMVTKPPTKQPIISSAANYLPPTVESDKKEFSDKEEFSDK